MARVSAVGVGKRLGLLAGLFGLACANITGLNSYMVEDEPSESRAGADSETPENTDFAGEGGTDSESEDSGGESQMLAGGSSQGGETASAGDTSIAGDGGEASLAGASSCAGGGTALSFKGSDVNLSAQLGVNLPSGRSPRTIELWVYTRERSWAQNRHTLVEYGENRSHHAFGIDMDAYPYMEVYSWDADLYFNTERPREGWFHVAATFDGTWVRAYVDGIERGSMENDGIVTSPTSVKIGWSSFPFESGASFDGVIDEVRIWNIARTAVEIRETLSVGLTGKEPGLVAYWSFDEGSGIVAHDRSSTGAHATLDAGEEWVPSGITLSCQ